MTHPIVEAVLVGFPDAEWLEGLTDDAEKRKQELHVKMLSVKLGRAKLEVKMIGMSDSDKAPYLTQYNALGNRLGPLEGAYENYNDNPAIPAPGAADLVAFRNRVTALADYNLEAATLTSFVKLVVTAAENGVT